MIGLLECNKRGQSRNTAESQGAEFFDFMEVVSDGLGRKNLKRLRPFVPYRLRAGALVANCWRN